MEKTGYVSRGNADHNCTYIVYTYLRTVKRKKLLHKPCIDAIDRVEMIVGGVENLLECSTLTHHHQTNMWRTIATWIKQKHIMIVKEYTYYN